jgi:hypothetical protein
LIDRAVEAFADHGMFFTRRWSASFASA